ncbi:MAG TPA: hypothetical protein PKI55_12390 [Chitinophagaceae bacterium]|nr:hypothetical protein [Chitinophagaceae bacterium]
MADQSISNQPQVDSFHTFEYQIDFVDKNIINKSDRNVDLLFNGIDNYFGGKENSTVRFRTECMGCLSIQAYQGGLLFGKRLFITADNIKYYNNNIDIPDSINRVNLFSDGRERTNPKFNFKDGNVNIKYIGISCNDADFNRVRLTFPSGDIIIDSLINASFFEYDLDADGQKEQYLLGLRNCSQELAILRIRK